MKAEGFPFKVLGPSDQTPVLDLSEGGPVVPGRLSTKVNLSPKR